MTSPLARLAQAGRSAEEGGAAVNSRRTAALALAGTSLALEYADHVPTRAYLRCRLERWWWQKQEQVARSEALLSEGNVAEAERPWRAAVARLSAALGESDWEALEARIELAGLLVLQGGTEKLAEAERLLRPPAGLGQSGGRTRSRTDSLAAHQELRMVHRLSCQRVSCLAGQGRLADAEVLARSCVDESIAHFGEFHDETARAKDALREAIALREVSAAPRDGDGDDARDLDTGRRTVGGGC